MPSFPVCLRRLVSGCVAGLLFLYLYTLITTQRKYSLKHDYAGYYKNDKAGRIDLKPDIVYRGTDVKANVSDLGLVKTKQEKEEVEEGYRDYAYNVLASRRLGRIRDLPDTRHKTCLERQYDSDLPPASVIICFFNEHPPTLIRTVETVLQRTPPQFLHEVLLVNDGSTNSLDDITSLVGHDSWAKVRLIHTNRREGLIRARILGAQNATGASLVFLDSHVECNLQWIEPLLQRIKDSFMNVATPIIDSIDPDTLNYKPSPLVRGGMNWGLNFQWDSLPENYLDKPEKFSQPILSPTMAGGLFAINKKYFHKLGEYDRGLEIWGGENIELSLRIWMCGGRLEIVPCSRVGHIFRKRRPYSSTNTRGEDTQILNVARVAKVWLGDYIKYFHETLPEAAYVDVGDISDRVNLKQRLKCEDFRWFHETIYPELLLPGATLSPGSRKKIKYQRWDERSHDFVDSFQLVHKHSGMCAQTTLGIKQKGSEMSLKDCMRKKEQTLFLTSKSELMPGGYLCLDASKKVRLQKCTEMEGPQQWSIARGKSADDPVKIYNKSAGLCLGVEDLSVTNVLCDEDSAQIWILKPTS